jgi:hypothetical protein
MSPKIANRCAAPNRFAFDCTADHDRCAFDCTAHNDRCAVDCTADDRFANYFATRNASPRHTSPSAQPSDLAVRLD